MEVVTVRTRGPFEPDDRGELPRLVILVCRRCQALPDRTCNLLFLTFERVLQRLHCRCPHVERLASTFNRPGTRIVIGLLAPGVLEQGWVGLGDHRREAKVFSVIGDDEEI